MALTVTATQSGAGTTNGMALTVKVLTGISGTQPGTTASSATVTTPQLAITPGHTGSVVYGAVGSSSGSTAFTAATGTTFSENFADTSNGAAYGAFRSTATTTSGTPVTLGATAPTVGAGSAGIALAEIVNSGTLTEDASAPAPVTTVSAHTLTTASFTPPTGSLLVAMTSTDNGAGVITMTVTDSQGLTWTQQASAAGSASSYAGVWTAPIGAVTHTASAAVAETVTIAATGSVSTITLTASAARAETVTISAAGTKPQGQAILAIAHATHNMGATRPITDLVTAAGTHTGSGGITNGSQLIGMFTGAPSSGLNMSTNVGPNALLVSASYPVPSVTAAQTTPLKTIPGPGRGWFEINGTAELTEICAYWTSGATTAYVANNNAVNKGGIVPGGGMTIDGYVIPAGTYVFQFMDFPTTFAFASPGPSVLFRGCRLRGAATAPGFFNTEFGGTWTGDLLIHFCDIGGNGAATGAVAEDGVDVEQGGNLRLYRNHVSYCGTGIHPNMGTPYSDVIQNFVEKLTNGLSSGGAPWHLNGISVNGGNTNFIWSANHVVIALFDENGAQVNQTDCLSMLQNFGTFPGGGTNSDASVGYKMVSNYAGGTGYCFYLGLGPSNAAGSVANLNFTGNSVTTSSYATGGNYGAIAELPTWGANGNTESANLWADGASSGTSFV